MPSSNKLDQLIEKLKACNFPAAETNYYNMILTQALEDVNTRLVKLEKKTEKL